MLVSSFSYSGAAIKSANRKRHCYPIRKTQCRDEQFFTEQISKNLQEMYGNYIEGNLTFTFIDSESQLPENIADAHQQQKFKENVNILLDFAKSKTEYQFATAGDIFEETDRLNIEVQELRKNLSGIYTSIL